MTALLLYTCMYLFFAVAAVLVSQRLGLGSVLGYLIAGIVIGPVLGFVGDEAEKIQHIAEFGVVMMLFLVGLELAPQMLWQMRHKLLGLGGLQVGLSVAALAAAAMYAFGLDWRTGTAIGCILALSSTAIVLQTFSEKNLLATAGGQAGFAVLLFQDVAAIPMLALLPLLAVAPAASPAAHGKLLAAQPGWVLAAVSVAAMLLIVLAVRYAVPRMFRLIVKTHLRELFTLFTLALVVGIAALMSLVGLSPALGAFIAGVALANSSYRHEMESNLEPFKGLLLGLFFITVGAGMNFAVLGREFWLIAALTLATLGIKMLILWSLGKLFRLPALGAKLFALSLAQAGEFGFVLLSIADQGKVLTAQWLDRIALVVALSMVLTPLLFIVYEKILLPRSRHNPRTPEREHDAIHESNPVILLGHGRFGHQINSLLNACGFASTVIDHHAETVERLTEYGIKTHYGDATRPELLISAGLHEAKLVAVCIGDRHRATDVVAFIRRHCPKLPIIARAYDRLHAYDLHHAGADYIIRETFDSAMNTGQIALEILGVPPQKAAELRRFYEKRDLYQLEKATELYDPNLSFFANSRLVETAQRTDAETAQLMRALMRGDAVAWQPDPEGWASIKQGLRQ
ncbi:monovalent cation:proton antiporter-2 (CPA2) family protein [Conchiformibius kuhniae]|uniref:Monovalent cation:proton antiporter-2 (CPA2) family protein n=1 Tax=Conchiformibius kuhniae TaxID=211502 RepID=A0A8T9MUX2_9NEIS|nr:monovalent cation:proton antiporter-2 (CPA2) family protein [Conchiformibius kuhniae]